MIFFFGELFQKFAYCCCCFWFFNFSCKAEDVAPRSVLDEQLSHLVIWVQEKGKRGNAFCVMRTKKKINTRFFKIALESLWETRPYSFNTFPYSTSPIIIITFQGTLKEVAIPHYDFWHLLHFPGILHRLYLNWNAEQEVIFQVLITMVFLFIINARPFAHIQKCQSVYLLTESSLLLSLIHMTKELNLN